MNLEVVDVIVMQRRNDSLIPEISINELPDGNIQTFFLSIIHPFDLFEENLYRCEIYRSDNDCYLFKDVHHILNDSLSENIWLDEIQSVIKGKAIHPETYTLFDYALESFQYSVTEDYKKDEKYFKSLLNGLEVRHILGHSMLTETEICIL